MLYGPPIKRLCLSYEANREKANDLNQEIWTSIWMSLSDFEGRCSLKTWIYRIAHNKALTHVAKEVKASRLLSLDDLEEQIADERQSLTRNLENKDTLEQVHDLLKTMKLCDRQVFWLFIEGHSQAEIAAITGLTPTHISTRVSRVRKVLATLTC
jgi:RNA polymerase sigma-70 factor (ECF subfamily)